MSHRTPSGPVKVRIKKVELLFRREGLGLWVLLDLRRWSTMLSRRALHQQADKEETSKI